MITNKTVNKFSLLTIFIVAILGCNSSYAKNETGVRCSIKSEDGLFLFHNPTTNSWECVTYKSSDNSFDSRKSSSESKGAYLITVFETFNKTVSAIFGGAIRDLPRNSCSLMIIPLFEPSTIRPQDLHCGVTGYKMSHLCVYRRPPYPAKALSKRAIFQYQQDRRKHNQKNTIGGVILLERSKHCAVSLHLQQSP